MRIAALNVTNIALRACEINYILYVLELSHAPYCNLIGAWKFLNGDKPDVHYSQTLSLSPGILEGLSTRLNTFYVFSIIMNFVSFALGVARSLALLVSLLEALSFKRSGAPSAKCTKTA